MTVACVWVKANVPYSVEYVARLLAMVRRHLPRPFRFVCLTDRVSKMPTGVEPIAVANPRPMAGWWSKIELFKPGRFTGRVLYLDLDTLVVRSLDPVVDYPAPFALIPHSGSFEGRHGLAVVKRFNSSVMVWDAGSQDALHRQWSPAVTHRLWGDQDWIGEQAIDAQAMPIEWFPRLSAVGAGPVPSDARVVLAKTPKPVDAARRWPWVDAAWRAA